MEKISRIQNFYNGLNVFITGGTGFMGKILIEKLLRSTEVSTIYILIRPKRGKDVHTRMDELFDDIVFDQLRLESVKFKHRVVSVNGDCSASGLGLSITDRQLLISKVDVVLHAAATVRFDEGLKLAYTINVGGTKDVLELAREMTRLKALVHVSTAYSNCWLPEIDEVFYDCPVKHDELERLLNSKSGAEVEKLTPSILGQWPNTYTFTKAVAENLIKDYVGVLPVAVFRPAIVISTSKEPLPGWIDNIYGPTGACAAAATGLLRILYCNKDVKANIVPVDNCVAALISIAWDVSENRHKNDNLIYNYVSSEDNPITWGEYHSLNYLHTEKYPLSSMMWAVKFHTTTNLTAYRVQKFLFHVIPALVFDLACLCLAQKPRLLSMYKKVHKLSDVIAYFCNRDWKFTTANTGKLWGKMTDADRAVFAFDIKSVLWTTYFKGYILGIRKYLLKDPLDTLPVARRKRRRFEMLHSIFKYCLYFLIVQLLWRQLCAIMRAIGGR